MSRTKLIANEKNRCFLDQNWSIQGQIIQDQDFIKNFSDLSHDPTLQCVFPKPFLPADTAGRKEKPIHEDSRAVVIRVVRQQSMPLVLLLTCTISTASRGFGFAATRYLSSFMEFSMTTPINHKLPANLLVYCLFKLLVVQDCSHLPVAVAGPVRCHYLHLGLAHVLPGDHQMRTKEGKEN